MATYVFTDLAPSNPKYIEMEVNSDGTTLIKKDYLKVSVVGDLVVLRWHKLEAGKNTHTLSIHFSDVTSPSEGSASDLKDALEDFIKTGVTGTDGVDGDDGREIELQVNATHIQWRYVGEVSWTDLVALSTITGATGATGSPGADGADGRALLLEMHTDVVGTATAAEELLHAFTIPGGTVVNGDSIDLQVLGTFASSSGSDKTFRIRVDTSATGVTGTIVAQFQSNNSSGNTIPLKIFQDIKCKAIGSSSTLETAYTGSGAFSQGFLAVLSNPNINLANTWYIKITSDKAVSGDTMTLKYANVIINKA